MVGGVLLSLGWGLDTVFSVAAVPAFIAALAMLAMASVRDRVAAPAVTVSPAA